MQIYLELLFSFINFYSELFSFGIIFPLKKKLSQGINSFFLIIMIVEIYNLLLVYHLILFKKYFPLK